MKTLTKTLFATVLTAVILTSSAFVTFASNQSKLLLAAPKDKLTFNKIMVSGNVKIILTQSNSERIEVMDDINLGKISIKRKGYTLMVDSKETRQITVLVSVKDLQRINASGKSTVETNNNLDVKYLQIFLKNDATVKVKACIGSLYTSINDKATLKLTGSADEHFLIANNLANTDFQNFVCLRTQHLPNTLLVAAKTESIGKK